MRRSDYNRPHAFARMEATSEEILSRYGSDHITRDPGDRVSEVTTLCNVLDVDYDGFGSAGEASLK